MNKEKVCNGTGLNIKTICVQLFSSFQEQVDGYRGVLLEHYPRKGGDPTDVPGEGVGTSSSSPYPSVLALLRQLPPTLRGYRSSRVWRILRGLSQLYRDIQLQNESVRALYSNNKEYDL